MKYEDFVRLLSDTSDEGVKKLDDFLKRKAKNIPITKLMNEWDSEKHDVTRESKRPKREVKIDTGLKDKDDNDITRIVQEEVNRITVPFQQMIVGKAVSFLFGNPVILKTDSKEEAQVKILEYLKNIYEEIKIESIDRLAARECFRSTQVAEIWYVEKSEETHELYGFPADKKVRMMLITPWDGDVLIPILSTSGNMIAFVRRYNSDALFEDREIEHVVVYTKDNTYFYSDEESVGQLKFVNSEVQQLKMIPVIFGEQENAEWALVQRTINRLEYLLSNHADTNDYNGSPTVVATGDVRSIGKKGETGKLIEMEANGKLEYMSWDAAPESIRMEIENSFKIILTYTQTPDISFESIKGVGAISGIALRILFMDAHLKVLDKRAIFDPYLKRRTNLVKRIIGIISPKDKNASEKVKIQSVITPFTIEDEMERINLLLAANGGQTVISQKESVRSAGLVDNPDEDYETIKEEEKERIERTTVETVNFDD